jgi:hypothetical protein
MSVGELLDAVFSLYRRNFLLIAAISAVVQVPYAALQFVLFEWAGYTQFRQFTIGTFPSSGTSQAITPGQLQSLESLLSGVLIASFILFLVSVFFVLPLAEAATTRAVSDRYLDRDSSLRIAYGAAFRRLGALIIQSLILFAGFLIALAVAVFILVGLAIAAGVAGALLGVLVLIAVLVGAVFVYVRTSLAAPAIVLEGLSGWRGLQRSWQLVRGVYWRMLGIRLLILVIAAIITGIVSGLLSLAGSGLDANGQFIVTEIAGAIAAVFVGPITYIAVTLLYYDTRIRKEGFDIEMLARSL